MTIENAVLRQFILQFFGDEDLDTLCFDYFPEVQQNFTTGMTKNRKALLLIGYCESRGRMNDLYAALDRERKEAWNQAFAAPPAETARRTVSIATPSRDPRQIFLSHATADAEFTHTLAADLRAEGWRVWIAPDSIRPGEKWVEAIDRGLETSGVFLVVLTPDAVTSRWVRTETSAAMGMEHKDLIRFIPLDVAECQPPWLWTQYQYIPFRGSYEVGLDELLRWLDYLPVETFHRNVSTPPDEAVVTFAPTLPSAPPPQPRERYVKEEQWRQLQALAHEIAAELGRRSGEDELRKVYRQFNRKFGLTTYKKLPRRQFAEGLAFLMAWRDEIAASSPVEPQHNLPEREGGHSPTPQSPPPLAFPPREHEVDVVKRGLSTRATHRIIEKTGFEFVRDSLNAGELKGGKAVSVDRAPWVEIINQGEPIDALVAVRRHKITSQEQLDALEDEAVTEAITAFEGDGNEKGEGAVDVAVFTQVLDDEAAGETIAVVMAVAAETEALEHVGDDPHEAAVMVTNAIKSEDDISALEAEAVEGAVTVLQEEMGETRGDLDITIYTGISEEHGQTHAAVVAIATRVIEPVVGTSPATSPNRRIHEKTSIELSRIPSGPFLYGSADSDEMASYDEKPQRTVDLPEYWIGRTPVTNTQYKRFLDANPKHRVPYINAEWAKPYNWEENSRTYPSDKIDHPVVLVSWDDAKAYCDWAGLALPSEEQWEKAARGTDGRLWPWGNDQPTDQLCNFNKNIGSTTPVGKYSPKGDSPYFCADMAGNTWEQTGSWYRKGSMRALRGRAMRGGSWGGGNQLTRAACRLALNPVDRLNNVGFRVTELLSDPDS